MSDETQMIRTIDWRSVFPFTQLFRAFRVAIHPAKLVLALIAILLVYAAARTMDAVWPASYSAVPNEVTTYAGASGTEFKEFSKARHEQLKRARDQLAVEFGPRTGNGGAPKAEDVSDGQVKRHIVELRDEAVKGANADYDKLGTKTDDARKARDAKVRAAYLSAGEEVQQLRATEPRGLGLTFVEHEAAAADAVAKGVLEWNWSGGVLPGLGMLIFIGPLWAFGAHPVYFILFTIVALLVWSVFGGAIARIAAVHVSQDEKISVRQALRFSTNKLMSFFAAPVMPLLLVGAIVLLLAVVGWLSEIPVLGGLLTVAVGVAFVLLICVGVLVACALVGWLCGFGLMYPTIAVEGSDAFDAVSRSFSYVFARPWKVLIYGVIAVVYGALTYAFLRFLVYLTLLVLHGGLTLWTHEAGPNGHTSLATAWPGPGLNNAGLWDLTTFPWDNSSLTLAESVGSAFLMFWVYLFVALLAAYVLSFFVSVNTIMYYLLRYDVDATEIDDVYLDPTDDELDDVAQEPALATPPTASSSSATTPSAEVPPSPVVVLNQPAMPPMGGPIPLGQPMTDPLAPPPPPADESEKLPPPTPPPAGS